MASSEQQQEATTGSVPSPQLVGNAFVQQYYHILHQSPEHVHRFYLDISKLGRPEDNGMMGSVSTLEAINEKILSLDYGGLSAEIKSVDAQDSHDGAVLVLVTGYLTGKDDISRNFTQTFFLAPQDKGYFVLNDMFRYVEDANPDKNQILAGEIEAPLTPDKEPDVVQENHVEEKISPSVEEVNEEEVYNPSENEEALPVEEETPIPAVVDEVQDDSQLVNEPDSKIEDVPKKSYASILKVMKESGALLSATVSPPPQSLPKVPQVATPPSAPALPVETSVVSLNTVENGSNREVEADGYSIYVKNLPMNATPALLDAEFKRFGPIKSNGIQVRSNNGFCFGFVEFEVENAVQSAVKESPMMVCGRQVHVEVKKSNSRGNNRGRFPSGRGGSGFRAEGSRGRGNYGSGRGFNRGDFNNRNEFGNKTEFRNKNDFGNKNSGRGGGYANRGGDGSQRADNVGNSGGGRVNRAVGMAINPTVKNMVQQVPASA